MTNRLSEDRERYLRTKHADFTPSEVDVMWMEIDALRAERDAALRHKQGHIDDATRYLGLLGMAQRERDAALAEAERLKSSWARDSEERTERLRAAIARAEKVERECYAHRKDAAALMELVAELRTHFESDPEVLEHIDAALDAYEKAKVP